MTAVVETPKHRIGKLIMLSQREIDKRRADLEKEYGNVEGLRMKKVRGVISTDEFLALQCFGDLDYLEGK